MIIGYIPIGSMYAIYMLTFTTNIPQMLAYIPYMDPMGYGYIMVHQFASTLLHLAVKDQPDLQRIYIEMLG